MFISEDWYICEIPSMQVEIVARSMLDSDFFVVTLPPLGYFDIAFALCVWRYKGTKFLSNILIFVAISYWLSVN
jgi:hypothetical protein